MRDKGEFQTLLPISYLSSSVTEIKKTCDLFHFLFDRLFTTFSLLQRLTNRKQYLKFHWIFKQLKKSKTTSEGVTVGHLYPGGL